MVADENDPPTSHRDSLVVVVADEGGEGRVVGGVQVGDGMALKASTSRRDSQVVLGAGVVCGGRKKHTNES